MAQVESSFKSEAKPNYEKNELSSETNALITTSVLDLNVIDESGDYNMDELAVNSQPNLQIFPATPVLNLAEIHEFISSEQSSYENLFLEYVIFPQYRMIRNLTDLPAELFMNAKAFTLFSDPIFILIHGRDIKYSCNVHHKTLNENFTIPNDHEKNGANVKMSKLVGRWTRHLTLDGVYIFEIIIKSNIISIIDCYVFNNMILINESYSVRLNILNGKMAQFGADVVIARTEPDVNLEETLLMSKKKGLMIKNLQLNGTQRLDYIVGGNRDNIAPYKFAIIGYHTDKNNKRRYIILARKKQSLQVCAVTKLSTTRANSIEKLAFIVESEYQGLGQFCWHCKRPAEGSICYYRRPLIATCTVRNTGYISVVNISKTIYRGSADDNDGMTNNIMSDFIKLNIWLLNNVDEYPEIIKTNLFEKKSSDKTKKVRKKMTISVSEI